MLSSNIATKLKINARTKSTYNLLKIEISIIFKVHCWILWSSPHWHCCISAETLMWPLQDEGWQPHFCFSTTRQYSWGLFLALSPTWEFIRKCTVVLEYCKSSKLGNWFIVLQAFCCCCWMNTFLFNFLLGRNSKYALGPIISPCVYKLSRWRGKTLGCS